jgi:hypothetical protein
MNVLSAGCHQCDKRLLIMDLIQGSQVRWLDLSSYDTNSLPYQRCTHFGRRSDGERNCFGLHCEKYLE